MNEQLIREVLDEQADHGMPVSSAQNLWPSIYQRIQSGERTRDITPSASSQQSRITPRPKPLLTAGLVAVALVMALGAVAWFAPPAPVSAAEILTRSEQAASAPGVKSFHGVWSGRLRNKGTEPFYASDNESWYLAPNSRRSEGRNVWPDGQEETSLLVQNEQMIWLYMPGHSENNPIILKDIDNSVPVFGGSDLGSVTGMRWLNDWFEAKLVGTEVVMGRNTYILEFTLKPADQWPPDSRPGGTARMKYWIDQQAYFTLKIEGWDTEGNEVMAGEFTDLQIDAPVDPSLFSFAPPPGAQVLDARQADPEELNTLWKHAAQQAPFRVYRPTTWSSDFREGRPYYDAPQSVLTQAFPRANPRHADAFEAQMPFITQRRASGESSAGAGGKGQTVKVGNLTGTYLWNESVQTLTIVREGTEIALSMQVVQGGIDMMERMVQMLTSLELVQK